MESTVLNVKEKERSHDTCDSRTVRKGAMEEVTKLDLAAFYSILFLRLKTSGEMRPIIDLKLLNKIIVNQTFQMESARTIQSPMEPNQWAISIDLMDAYFHIPFIKTSGST